MELDVNVVLEQYKRKLSDLQHENIMLVAQVEALFVIIKELETPKEEAPKEKKGVK